MTTIHDNRPADTSAGASDQPQTQASGVRLPNGASLEFQSRYPGVTMIVVAGLLQVFLMLFSTFGRRFAAPGKPDTGAGQADSPQ